MLRSLFFEAAEHHLFFRCRFRDKVEVRHYRLSLENKGYAVKFHLKAHRQSDNKYNLMTGFYEARQCIRTSFVKDEVELNVIPLDISATAAGK